MSEETLQKDRVPAGQSTYTATLLETEKEEEEEEEEGINFSLLS